MSGKNTLILQNYEYMFSLNNENYFLKQIEASWRKKLSGWFFIQLYQEEPSIDFRFCLNRQSRDIFNYAIEQLNLGPLITKRF